MRKEDAQAYVARYKAAEQIELAELRAMTPQQKWEKMLAARALIRKLGLKLEPDDKSEIYERWARLKQGK